MFLLVSHEDEGVVVFLKVGGSGGACLRDFISGEEVFREVFHGVITASQEAASRKSLPLGDTCLCIAILGPDCLEALFTSLKVIRKLLMHPNKRRMSLKIQ